MKKITRSEVYRYLGYGRNIPDETVKALVDECEEELTELISPKRVYRFFDITYRDENTVKTEVLSLESSALSRNLRGCFRLAMTAATLGPKVDILLQKYSRISPGKAVVIQALAAAAMEDYMDEIEEEIRNSLDGGLYMRPRFSPGYADLSLEYQKDLFRILDVPRKIGATLMDNLIMAPSKTVTAFIGISRSDESVHEANSEEKKHENT